MKRRSGLFCVLLVLLLMGTAVSATALFQDQNNVTIEVTPLVGDPKTADWVTLSQHHVLQQTAQWDVTYNVWGEAETQFRFEKEVHEAGQVLPDLFAYPNLNFGYNQSGGDGLDLAELAAEGFPALIFADLADQTGAGETNTATVTLADYYPTFPLDFDYPFRHYNYDDGEVPPWVTDLNDYFATEVPPNAQMEVTLTKDATGAIRELDSDSIGEFAEPRVHTVLTHGDYMYLLYYLEDKDGYQDAPLTRHVHRVGYTMDMSREDPLSLSTPTPFADLAAGEEVRILTPSQDGVHLLMVTDLDEHLYLTQLTFDGAVTQRLDLGQLPEYWGGVSLYEGDDYLAILKGNGSYWLTLPTDQGYVLNMAGDYLAPFASINESQHYNYSSHTLAYRDGELAIAFAPQRWRGVEYTCLAIATPHGITYAGTYHLSLCVSVPIQDYYGTPIREECPVVTIA